MFKYNKFFIGVIFFFNSAFGQIYIKEGKNRYTFAQSTIGYDLEYTPITGFLKTKDATGELVNTKLGNSISPVISLTGLHFWGHAEFFTGFGLGDINLNAKNKSTEFKRSGSTGAKVFPYAVRNNRLSPYLGICVSVFSFQAGDGVKFKRVDYPILFGLTYSFKHGLLEVGGNYHYNNIYDYYISTTEITDLTIPKLSFTADFKYYFDFSLQSLKKEKEGILKSEFEKLKKHKALNTLSIGIGPAYSFVIGNSTYTEKFHPYIDDHKVTKFYPDIGLGYYFFKPDMTINLSYRSMNSSIHAYGLNQKIYRKSLALELYKFVGDYHGFVPFFGASLGYEKLQVDQSMYNGEAINKERTFVSPGFIFGWDIRPTRTDWWEIRTNLRYYPFLNITMENDTKIDFQQIELNFLQLVLFPNRMYAYFHQ